MSGLPKVRIVVNKDRLGGTTQTADGISAIVVSGVSLAGKIQVGQPEKFTSLAAAIAKGITETGTNAYAYKHVKQFYDEAKDGAVLWVMVVDQAVTMEQMADKTEPYAKKLLDEAKGAVRYLGISRKSAAGVTTANGLDEDVDKAVVKAQELADAYKANFKEFSVIIDGKDFSGDEADLKNYRTSDKDFVSVFIGNTDGSKNAAIGLLLGRLAKDPVHRNPARVKSGSLNVTKTYFTNGKSIHSIESSWDAIHDKGYIFFRDFVGRSGYFFTDAPTLTVGTNDLNSIPRVQTIYKARRIAYVTLVNELVDEIQLGRDGRIPPAIIKSWQALVENQIDRSMTANGEISAVKASLDPTQDVLGTDQVKLKLSVLPVGYSKYIDVDLGFVTSITN